MLYLYGDCRDDLSSRLSRFACGHPLQQCCKLPRYRLAMTLVVGQKNQTHQNFKELSGATPFQKSEIIQISEREAI